MQICGRYMPLCQITIPEAVASFPDILGTRETSPARPYTILRNVGSGVSGTAFLVNKTDGDRNVIAKITDLSSLSDKKKMYARSEIRCLSQCDHFAIIRHIDSAETQDHRRLLLLMELADAGDLAHQIKHRARENSYFKEHEIAFLFLQIVLAVDYMHRRGILHRDIKSANVFLMSCGTVKIGDLGFSQLYNDTLSQNHVFYLAPELWRRHRYSKKADVWSLGVLLYEMASLKRPFVASSMLDLYDRVVAGEYEPLPQVFSQDICDVIRSILAFDPDARPATGDILNMPYMRFVAQQFHNTINQNASFTLEEKTKITGALREALQAADALQRGPIAMPNRVVQRKGVVLKLGSSGWKSRYLLLAGGVLTMSVVENTVGDTKNLNMNEIQGVVPTSPQDVGGRVGCFCITLANNSGTHVYCQASNEDDARQWVEAIEQALEQYAAANSTVYSTQHPSAIGPVREDVVPSSPLTAVPVTLLVPQRDGPQPEGREAA